MAATTTPAAKPPEQKTETPEQKALREAAAKEAARIMASDEGANKADPKKDEPKQKEIEVDPRVRDVLGSEPYARAKTAAEKLRLIALSYPLTTPDSHKIFGFGGYVFTLGELRDLMDIRVPR